MELVKGIYKKTIFYNAERGSGSFLMKPASGYCEGHLNKFGNVKMSGEFCLQQEGLTFECEGEWVDTSYGEEFHFKTNSFKLVPLTKRDSVTLMTTIVPTSTSRTAEKIASFVGQYLFEAPYDPTAVDQTVKNTKVDQTIATEIFGKLRQLTEKVGAYAIVNANGGSFAEWAKIVAAFPENAVETLKKNAYDVLKQTQANFMLIDRIALANGQGEFSQERLQAIVQWCLRSHVNKGNAYVTQNELYGLVKKNFGQIPETAFLATLADHPGIIRDPESEGRYYLKELYSDENKAAKEIFRLTMSRYIVPWHPELIDRIEAEVGHKLGNQQRQAFQLLRTTGVKLFTGGPGTGKTTTVNCLLRYLELIFRESFGREPKFALCAPSGRAAQRMKETTGRDALTVHKLIGYQPFGDSEYYKNASDPIDADVVVVDETSMLGLSTFAKLLGAIRNGSLVLLVGDVNQLQSVEPGNVLADISSCGYVDSCHLTEVFRQKAESLINVNANKVMAGDASLLEGKDFEIITTDPENTRAVLEREVKALISQAGNKEKVQVLSPVKKGDCGVNASNKFLQEIFNPPVDPDGKKGGIWFGSKNFRVGDRVMTQSNNYALNYFNGDVGTVVSIPPDGSSMTIRIGEEEITVPKEKFGDVDLAYCVTVHKSQGSEYDYLVIVLQKDSGGMLDRNLFYTAITRGKKKVVVVAEDGCIDKAVRTARKKERDSALPERIRKKIESVMITNKTIEKAS